MPGIVVFRRRWSVGSDDLVVPGVFLFTIHFIWASVLVAVLLVVLVPYDSLKAECVQLLWQYILGYLAILTGSLLLEALISAVALRGSILDTEARASMQYLLYVRLGIMAVELVWLILGVLWLVYHYNDCPAAKAKEVMMGLVICNWCILLSILMTVWCTFDAAGRSWVKMKEYQRSMREAESRFQYKRSGNRNRNWRQRKVLRAYQDSWNHRCRLLFCCMGNSDRNRNSFADIARLLSDFFRDLDVVPSDVVAGLVLLRKFQKIEREAIVKQRKNDTYEYLSGVAVTSQTQFLALTDPSDLQHFQDVIHFMHFALGAYGWPMFLMTYSGTGICKLCASVRCSCIPCFRRKDNAVIVEDNCCQCNYAALRKMVDVGEVAVVYATYHVDVGETPFFVAVDYSKHKVVVSIRGTLSLQDVITDLNAEGEPLPLNPPKEDWLGHKGMVHAAEYIRLKLKEEAILESAFSHDPARGTNDFELVLVGHSLGAGTASILAILLQQEYPTVTCFAYSPPGGTLSMPAVEHSKSFITSVVVGKDVVPRIGLHQLEALRADLINTIKRSKDPKWKTIFCSVVCCGCAPIPTSAVELRQSSMDEYQQQKDAARESVALHPSDSSIALTVHQPLYPPGRIIHVVRHHPSKGEQKYEKRWRQILNKHEPVYQAVWANTTDFDEVLISPVMIQDHMPDNVLEALNKVVTTIGPAKPQRTLSNNNSTLTSAEHLEHEEQSHLLNSVPTQTTGSPKVATPPHRLCLETSFTSLQSPSSDIAQPNVPASLDSSICSHQNGSTRRPSPFALLHPVLSWEYPSLLDEQPTTADIPDSTAVDFVHDEWFGLAPLATPESLSEVSSISSRASNNLEKVWKDTNQYWIAKNEGGKTLLGGTVPDKTAIVTDESREVNSSGDDLSFISAMQTCSDNGNLNESSPNNGASSDVFVSVKGTPFSSSDSVTVNADIHCLLPDVSDSPASLPCKGTQVMKVDIQRPASIANIAADLSSHLKQVKFSKPDKSIISQNRYTRTLKSIKSVSSNGSEMSCDQHNSDLSTASVKSHSTDGNVILYNFTLNDLGHDSTHSYLNKNEKYYVRSSGTDDNCLYRGSGNNNFQKLPYEKDHRAKKYDVQQHKKGIRIRECTSTAESLPLLSNIGEVKEIASYSQKKYVYPITSIGKGESSV